MVNPTIGVLQHEKLMSLSNSRNHGAFNDEDPHGIVDGNETFTQSASLSVRLESAEDLN